MPKISRGNVPPALLAHLVDRRSKWGISYDQIAALATWLQFTQSDLLLEVRTVVFGVWESLFGISLVGLR